MSCWGFPPDLAGFGRWLVWAGRLTGAAAGGRMFRWS